MADRHASGFPYGLPGGCGHRGTRRAYGVDREGPEGEKAPSRFRTGERRVTVGRKRLALFEAETRNRSPKLKPQAPSPKPSRRIGTRAFFLSGASLLCRGSSGIAIYRGQYQKAIGASKNFQGFRRIGRRIPTDLRRTYRRKPSFCRCAPFAAPARTRFLPDRSRRNRRRHGESPLISSKTHGHRPDGSEIFDATS